MNVLKNLDKEMKDFLKFKGYKELSVKEKFKSLLIYPLVLTIYTYAFLQHKLSK